MISTITLIIWRIYIYFFNSGKNLNLWRARVGSSYANSGGTIYSLRSVNIHPSFNSRTLDSDIAVLRTTTLIAYASTVAPGSIASSSYVLADGQVVWAVGWGYVTVKCFFLILTCINDIKQLILHFSTAIYHIGYIYITLAFK